MRVSVLLLAILILQACNTNDDVTCDGDPIPLRLLFINLIDAEGTNLIEAGTLNYEDIEVEFNGFINPSPFFKNDPKFENLIIVTVVGNEGNNSYKIRLSNSETDTLILNLSEEALGSGPCSYSGFTINSASYNGIDQTVEDFDSWNYLITVTK